MRSPIKQKMKNRRNISIKQSWDKTANSRSGPSVSNYTTKKRENEPINLNNN
jgi:hypothetical protein